MRFEQRLLRALREEQQRDDASRSACEAGVYRVLDRVFQAAAKEGIFPHKYEHRSVGICLNCGPFNHTGPHICPPKVPAVTISGERFDQLLRWERWGRDTAGPTLDTLRDRLTAALAMSLIPEKAP